MLLELWAKRWGVPPQALAELQGQLLGYCANHEEMQDRSESAVLSIVRLEAARAGFPAWRNNTGALPNPETGGIVRFGLANDSARVNKVLKSSDLIGCKPVLITPAHVGLRIGQFWARETKHGGWRYTGTEREVAQLNFITLVNALGGDAAFASSEGTV